MRSNAREMSRLRHDFDSPRKYHEIRPMRSARSFQTPPSSRRAARLVGQVQLHQHPHQRLEDIGSAQPCLRRVGSTETTRTQPAQSLRSVIANRPPTVTAASGDASPNVKKATATVTAAKAVTQNSGTGRGSGNGNSRGAVTSLGFRPSASVDDDDDGNDDNDGRGGGGMAGGTAGSAAETNPTSFKSRLDAARARQFQFEVRKKAGRERTSPHWWERITNKDPSSDHNRAQLDNWI